MLKITQNLDSKKATQKEEGMPVGIMKENKFIFSKFSSQTFDFYLDSNAFLNLIKEAGIKTVYKKKMTLLKKLITDQ